MFGNVKAEKERWDKRAEIYEGPKGVFSLTKYPSVLSRILSQIKPGRVLDFGCGPTARMLRAIENSGSVAEGVDLSEKMLEETRRNGFSRRLICEDTCRLASIEDGRYTSVVSLNSILPPERADASAMLRECYRVLERGGIFVALVMSFDYHLRLIKEFPEIVMDIASERLWDEEGWQCAFSKVSMERELARIGFSSFRIEPFVFREPEVADDIARLYGIRLPDHLALEEILVVAVK